jgi:hypothetical protein
LNNNRLADDVGAEDIISNSAIFGSTSASSCSASLFCHAMVAGDVAGAGCNSVFGPTWRHVGIVSSQYLNKGKMCTSDVAGGGGEIGALKGLCVGWRVCFAVAQLLPGRHSLASCTLLAGTLVILL